MSTITEASFNKEPFTIEIVNGEVQKHTCFFFERGICRLSNGTCGQVESLLHRVGDYDISQVINFLEIVP